jgi:hypothetical protein
MTQSDYMAVAVVVVMVLVLVLVVVGLGSGGYVRPVLVEKNRISAPYPIRFATKGTISLSCIRVLSQINP